MVNNFSASASEIFAAAIQDYKRGIIIGSKHTFGKGTVQNIFDLNRVVRGGSYGDLGALKTTTQKFYRINGGSTQREGVLSDIVVPDRFTYIDMGERDEDNALAWDKITPADYLPVYSNFNNIIAKSKKRIDESSEFELIKENAKWISERKDDNVFSINLKKYEDDLKETDEILKKFKPIQEYNNHLAFSSLPYEIMVIEKDSILKEKRERWHEDMQKDIYLNEALNVLDDLYEEFPYTNIVQGQIKNKKLQKLD